MKKGEETTYGLLTAAQEKEKSRDIFEDGVYAIYAVTVMVAICQFAAIAKPLPKAIGSAHRHHPRKVHIATDSRPS